MKLNSLHLLLLLRLKIINEQLLFFDDNSVFCFSWFFCCPSLQELSEVLCIYTIPSQKWSVTTHTRIAAQSQTRTPISVLSKMQRAFAGCHNYSFQIEREAARSASLLYTLTFAQVCSNYFFHAWSIQILTQQQQADHKVFFFPLSHHLLVHSRAKAQNNHLGHRQQGSCHLDSRQCRRPRTRDLLTS